MRISSSSVPKGTKLTIWEEPVLGQSGLEALSPRIASVFARWSALEKQLDQVFTLVSEADEDARAEYDKVKGWDRRIDMVDDLAKVNLDVAKQDIVKAVLRLVKAPAKKRDELAHQVWAIAEGFEDRLVLLSSDNQHAMAEYAVAAKKAGTTKISVENKSIYESSRLVSAADLDTLREELQLGQQRLTDLIHGYLYEPFIDETGCGFSDSRSRIENDQELQARISNMERERQRALKRLNRKNK